MHCCSPVSSFQVCGASFLESTSGGLLLNKDKSQFFIGMPLWVSLQCISQPDYLLYIFYSPIINKNKNRNTKICSKIPLSKKTLDSCNYKAINSFAFQISWLVRASHKINFRRKYSTCKKYKTVLSVQSIISLCIN